jgi:hypothetical protein
LSDPLAEIRDLYFGWGEPLANISLSIVAWAASLAGLESWLGVSHDAALAYLSFGLALSRYFWEELGIFFELVVADVLVTIGVVVSSIVLWPIWLVWMFVAPIVTYAVNGDPRYAAVSGETLVTFAVELALALSTALLIAVANAGLT